MRDLSIMPRNGHTLMVLIVARISGCQNQKEVSLEDQIDHAKQETGDLFVGPCEYRVISTKGKGERLDRPELAEVDACIREGDLDLIVMEDVGRMVRGTAAVELWGLAFDRGIRCIAPNDGCDTAQSTWEEDLISACKDHVSHCAHTSRRIKQKQMNRFVRSGGAIPLPIYGYIKPQGAKFFGDLLKDIEANPVLRDGLDILKRTKSWTAVADYFNLKNVPTGPYCRKDRWDGAMVRRLYHNPILKGRPQRGARHSQKNNETGRRRTVVNPTGPTYRDEPHLAHFEADELDAVLAEVDDHHSALGRPNDTSGNRVRNSRKRTRFPGRCAICWYCGHELVWGGNGIADHLMCNGSRDYRCWNSIGMNGPLAAKNVMTAVTHQLALLEGVDHQFAGLTQLALAEWNQDHNSWSDLQAAENQFQHDEERVKSSILKSGPHPLLDEMLTDLERRKTDLARRRSVLEKLSKQKPQIPESVTELRAKFDEVSRDLAEDSLEMGDLLRSLVTGFHVYLVQSIDGGPLLPQAKVSLSLGEIVPDIARTPNVQNYLKHEVTINIFQPPAHVRIREEVVQQLATGLKQREVAAALGTHQVTVTKAVLLNRLMQERGLNSPYLRVTEPPSAETNKKMKRSRNAKYFFRCREGYVPPTFE